MVDIDLIKSGALSGLQNYRISDKDAIGVKDLYLVDAIMLSFILKNSLNKNMSIGMFSCLLDNDIRKEKNKEKRVISNLHGIVIDLDSNYKKNKQDKIDINPLVDEICGLIETTKSEDSVSFYPDLSNLNPDDLIDLLDTSSDVRNIISYDIELKSAIGKDNIDIAYKNKYSLFVKHKDKYFDISHLGEIKSSITESQFDNLSKLNDYFLKMSLVLGEHVKNFVFIPRKIIEVLTNFDANEYMPKYSNFFWSNYNKVIIGDQPNLLLNLAEKAFKEKGTFLKERAKALDLVAQYVINPSIGFNFSNSSKFNPTSNPMIFSYYFQERMLTSELHDKVTCWNDILSVKAEKPYIIRADTKNNRYSIKVSPLSCVVKYVIDSGNYFSENIGKEVSTFNSNIDSFKKDFIKRTASIISDVIDYNFVETDTNKMQFFIEKGESNLLSNKSTISNLIDSSITRLSEFCTKSGKKTNIFIIGVEIDKLKTDINLRLGVSEKVSMDVKKYQVSKILNTRSSKNDNHSTEFKL